MRLRLVLLLSLLALACLVGSAHSTSYYVATNGDDGWPGTEAQPWATLDYAVDQISPGDTILIKSGTYAGCRIENSGLPGSPCTLKADDDAAVVVNAAGATCRHDSNIEVEWYDNIVRYWVIEDLEVKNSSRYGFDLRGTEYITIRNCYAHDNASTGIFNAHSYYQLFEDNVSCYNGEHGIYQSNSGDYMTARGNELGNNTGAGIHQNGDERYSPPGDGLIAYSLIEDNVVYENSAGLGVGALNNDGAINCMFRNNLLYENHGSGISFYAQDGAAGSRDNEVYNNTFVMADDAYYVVNITKSRGNTPQPTGNKIYNNILYNPNPGSLRGCIRTYDEAVPGFESDYNVVCEPFAIKDTPYDFTTWQSWGYDLHSFMATPDQLFVDPQNNDYRLKSGSPAIDAGTTLADVTDDIEGTSRPQGDAYDIGCYESAGGPVAPTAEFSGNPTSGPPTLTVYFTDLSTGSPTSWDWTFGDGGTSSAEDPSHDYTTENTYTVSLTVENAQGQDTETKVDYITVADQSCHVGAIDMFDDGPPNYIAGATVTIHDQDCTVLAGVTVEIEWSGAVTGTDSDVTDEYGQVTFSSDRNKSGGTFICTVTNLTKTGYPYQSGDNHEDSDQITLP